MIMPRRALFLGLALLPFLGTAEIHAAKKPAPVVAPIVAEIPDSAEGKALRAALEKSGYSLTPAVKAAWLTMTKAETRRELAAAGKTLPADFMTWAESDPVIESTVYAARAKPADVLLMLRSLELDAGKKAVREEYTQFALALAVVHSNRATTADITPREPMKLVIPGDPRVPVDTKAKDRPLDVNDHIINFLEDHAPVVEDVVVGKKEEIPELKYDDKGIAIPAPKKPVMVNITEKRSRTLTAADVFASRALQEEFNAYMAAHGQKVEIDCGDKVIFPKQSQMIKGPYAKGISAAYKLFRAAYEAKGRLPAARDAAPTPAESFLFITRNDRFRFTPEVAAKRAWPRFPLTAPWPMLTLLAADSQPLREREDIWVRYRDKGEKRSYGEYIGPIAQQFDFQSARRLAPYPYSYNTFQMMCKDGGVCGTMGNMGARTNEALGTPSCTAGQPGHCALITAGHNAKTGTFNFHGEQYATGGDEATNPHGLWVFGDINAPRPMVWHQSVAWGVNAGTQSYLDSMIALRIFRSLPEADREKHGTTLLRSGLELNPYNFALLDAAQRVAKTPEAHIAALEHLRPLLAANAGKPGLPTAGALYETTAKKTVFARIAATPPPADRAAAARVNDWLRQNGCENPDTNIAYAIALEGVTAVADRVKKDYAAHLAGERTDAAGAYFAGALTAVSKRIPDAKTRKQWTAEVSALAAGRDNFFNAKNQVRTDPSVVAAAKLAGLKPAPADTGLATLRQSVGLALQNAVAGERDLKACRTLAARITALGKATKDAAALATWSKNLGVVIAGKETFRPKGAKPKAKPLRDPCADAIAALAKTA